MHSKVMPQANERWCCVGVAQIYTADGASFTLNYDRAHPLPEGQQFSSSYIIETDDRGVIWGVCPACAHEFATYGTH